jgi:hypothetical protein
VEFAGTIRVWQLLTNYGISHSLLALSDLAVETKGGLTYSAFSSGPEDLLPGEWAASSPVNTHKAFGIFIGFVAVHQLASGPLSAYLQAQYSHLWPSMSSGVSNYGLVDASVGIRFYLGYQ